MIALKSKFGKLPFRSVTQMQVKLEEITMLPGNVEQCGANY